MKYARQDESTITFKRIRLTVTVFSRKEVFQPHLPVRLPCYDLAPVTSFYPRPLLAVTDFRYPQLPWLDGRCVQGPGTYSPRHG